MGSELGGLAAVPCDKFARGKSGLCASHTAQVQEKLVNGGSVLAPKLQNLLSSTVETVNGIFMYPSGIDATNCGGKLIGSRNYGHEQISGEMPPQDNLDEFSLPEGRVHGGNLLVMLRGSTTF